MIPIKERELQTITFYRVAHKKEEGTYHLMRNACIPQPWEGRASPLNS